MIPRDSSSCWRSLSNSTTTPAWINSFWVGLWSHAGSGMPDALQHSCNLALPRMLWLSNVPWSSGALLSPAEKQSLSPATPAVLQPQNEELACLQPASRTSTGQAPKTCPSVQPVLNTPAETFVKGEQRWMQSQCKQWLEVWNLLFWICPLGSPCFCELQKHSVKRSPTFKT